MYDRAGQRPGDPRHTLNLRYDKPAKVIHVLRLGTNDHVVGASDVVSWVTPVISPMAVATSAAFPTSVWIEDISLDHKGLPV